MAAGIIKFPAALFRCGVLRVEARRYPMEPRKFTLCPACTACPEVEITNEGVTIGERKNTVRLPHDEWNQLVWLIKSGELPEL